MITTHDIGNLFESMRIVYGSQWKHGPNAIGVWREALRKSNPDQIRQAANDCIAKYKDFPPTLPQFIGLVYPDKMKPAPNTYLPPPPMARALAQANKVMLKVVVETCGMDTYTLKTMVGLKNALAEDLVGDVTQEWQDDLRAQLIALIPTRSNDDAGVSQRK